MFYTIVTNFENKRSYLVSSDIDFIEIYNRINSYFIENSYLSILIMKRNLRFETMTSVLKKFKINYEEFTDKNQFIENKWIILWAELVNKILPESNLKVLEYFPISI